MFITESGCCFQRLCGSKRKIYYSLAGGCLACRPVSQKRFQIVLGSVIFCAMNIVESLLCHDEWIKLYEYKCSKSHLPDRVKDELKSFIDNKEYVTTAEKLNNGGFFSMPILKKVNKSNSDKKRKVFTFTEEEKYIQKMIAFKLQKYDNVFADNLYSFRSETGVKKAVKSLVGTKNVNEMYSYKLDISDYFNSINAELLLPVLKSLLVGEDRLYEIFEDMLLNKEAVFEDSVISVDKGVLAGSPVSGFLANLYLCDVDRYFQEKGSLYARYSDDIILFNKNKSDLESDVEELHRLIYAKGLSINENKVEYSEPHEEWTFLGFSYNDGVIDVSEISKRKLKGKMRRKARALVRWKNKKGAEPERAVRAFIRHFNKKLYDNPSQSEITWCRWYVPVINTDRGLKELDEYMQECIRFIATGSHKKSKYRFSYDDMKQLGYTTLVNHYYKYKYSKYEKHSK